MRVFADGSEFAQATVTVTTLGQEFRTGLSQEMTLPDFPEAGTDSVVVWQEAQQNFVIASALPTERLVEVSPALTLPAGVSVQNLAVSSFFAPDAQVLASLKPSLLLAEDAGGTVLLALANQDGGVLGEPEGRVEVSVDSTAVVLVGLAAGIAVADMTPRLADAIVTHEDYPALQQSLAEQIAANPNFLDHLTDHPTIVSALDALALDIYVISVTSPLESAASAQTRGGADAGRVQYARGALTRSQAAATGTTCPEESRLRQIAEVVGEVSNIFIPWQDALNCVHGLFELSLDDPHTARQCKSEADAEWAKRHPGEPIPYKRTLDRGGSLLEHLLDTVTPPALIEENKKWVEYTSIRTKCQIRYLTASPEYKAMLTRTHNRCGASALYFAPGLGAAFKLIKYAAKAWVQNAIRAWDLNRKGDAIYEVLRRSAPECSDSESVRPSCGPPANDRPILPVFHQGTYDEIKERYCFTRANWRTHLRKHLRKFYKDQDLPNDRIDTLVNESINQGLSAMYSSATYYCTSKRSCVRDFIEYCKIHNLGCNTPILTRPRSGSITHPY